MKNKIVLFVGLFIATSMCFVACQKEESTSSQQAQKVQETTTKNEIAKNFANVLLASLDNPEGRAFIKNEVLLQFDGDYNFVFSNVKDKKMSSTLKSLSNITFGDFLEKEAKKKYKSLTIDNYTLKGLLDSVTRYYPLLQISMPEISDSSVYHWNCDSEMPLVAVLPSDFDEKTTQSITAYDNKGNSYEIDTQLPYEKPIIVISENERLIAVSKKTENNKYAGKKIFFETEYYYYYLQDDIYSLDTNIKQLKADRDWNHNKDVLYKARFVSSDALRNVESWLKGKPDMKVVIVFAKNQTNTEFNSTTKILSNNGWYHTNWRRAALIDTKTIDVDILTWDINTYGDRMKYVWIEMDGGAKVTTDIGLDSKIQGVTVSGKVKIEYQDNDDACGDAIVEYQDPTNINNNGTKYSTGTIEFWIAQK